MYSKSLSVFAFTAGLSASLCGSASAAALLTRHVPAAVARHQAAPAGALDPATHMRMQVVLPMRNKGELDSLTSKLMAGAPGVKPLTSAEFMARHAPTAAQAQAVVAYLRGQGFSNIEVAANNLLVSATGGAGVIRTAFKADLHEYNVNGRRAYANVTDAMIPEHLSSTVLGVVGLQNVHLMHTHAQRMAAPDAAAPQAIAGVSIPNFASIYGASSLPSATTGTIGIITSGKVTQTITDLKSFASSEIGRAHV